MDAAEESGDSGMGIGAVVLGPIPSVCARREAAAAEGRGIGTLCVVEDGRASEGSGTIDAVGELEDVDAVEEPLRCVGWENGSFESPIRLSTEMPNCGHR